MQCFPILNQMSCFDFLLTCFLSVIYLFGVFLFCFVFKLLPYMVAPLSSGVWVPRQHEWERWWQDLRSQTCSPVKVWAGCSFGDSELSLLSHHVLECVFVAGLLDLIVASCNGIRQRLSSGHGCHTCINLALCTCRSAVVSPIPLTCRFLLQSSGVPVSFYLCFFFSQHCRSASIGQPLGSRKGALNGLALLDKASP